ncbi:CBS domain protein [compost metagenome]
MTLEEAEELMAEHQVRRLPVVEAGSNKLMGIVAQADIARMTAKATKSAGTDPAKMISEISKPGGEHSQATEG